MKKTREQIDKIFETAAKNQLLNLHNQLINAMNESDQKENPVALAIMAASIAQGNVMSALKEICYELIVEDD